MSRVEEIGESLRPSVLRRSVTTEPVTFRRVAKSEWIKFWTLRSTRAVLAAAVVGMVVLACWSPTTRVT